MKKYLLPWLVLLRLGPTARGVLPFLLGAVIVWSEGTAINLPILLLSTSGVICVMLMTFLVNDYYDYRGDKLNKDYHRLSGGSRVLPQGLVPRSHVLIAAGGLFVLTILISFVLQFIYHTGPYTLILSGVAVVIGYFYTAPPLRLAYRGLGELAIFFSCGWLAVASSYYLQTGHFNILITLISLPIGISVFLVILINELPDFKADKATGKRNLTVRLGQEKAGTLYMVLLALCYLSIVINFFFGILPVTVILSIILLPFIGWNILTIRKYGVAYQGIQERLSLSTMLIDHLITVIYAVGLIITGFRTAQVRIDHLLIIVLLFAAAFSLEAIGMVAARAVVKQT